MLKKIKTITFSFFIFLGIVSANEKTLGEAKSEACSSCHGITGNSSSPLIPIIAGQNARYLVNQLKAFKSGRRENDTMKVISESLSDDDMNALAIYYSTQEPSIMSGNILLLKKGKDKYSLCWSCHGENGEGPGSYPRIAGQHAQYTVQQLKNYKHGYRINPAMNAIVTELSDEDMEALGAYIASLNPHKNFINLGKNQF